MFVTGAKTVADLQEGPQGAHAPADLLGELSMADHSADARGDEEGQGRGSTRSSSTSCSPSRTCPEVDLLYKMMRDYPERGGKGMRPFLCVTSCRAFGGDEDEALLTAASLELFQNWILIHDDIEDGSEMRRGSPALHKKYDWTLALNTGDALHAQDVAAPSWATGGCLGEAQDPGHHGRVRAHDQRDHRGAADGARLGRREELADDRGGLLRDVHQEDLLVHRHQPDEARRDRRGRRPRDGSPRSSRPA